ncbi:MAG: lipoate--protein ligase [Sphaerochaeta sp.]|nr:lipoate--protein ligase [Sphaerochaeta sp.]
MSRKAIYVATSHDCAANLAGEAYLIKEDLDHILYLWVNDPCIVIGRFQNPYSECNLQRMDEQGVQLVRRKSGGGAVYHDRGNLCFTLIGKKDTSSKEENFALVLAGLKKLGIEAELSGRNDILSQGKKISGNAFQSTPTKFCHHGTLLITSDLSVMANYLTPSSSKLASKAVKSVASRVGNLSEVKSDITNKEVQDALIEAFCDKYGPTHVTPIDFKQLREAQDDYRLFSDRALILEKTPQFTHFLHHRFSWGECSLHMDVHKTKITEVRLFTDSLDTSLPERIVTKLEGLPYAKGALQDASQGCDDEGVLELLSFLIDQL